DEPIDSGSVGLVEVFPACAIDVLEQLAFVARRQRIAFHEPLGEPDHAQLEAAPELGVRSGASRNLDTASADVDDDGHVAGNTDAVHGGEMDEPRLFGSRDHP